MTELPWNQLAGTYDLVADAYETTFVDELEGKERDRELLASFADSVVDPVVELGCGPGHVGAFVRAQGRRVFGLDLSAHMLLLGQRRLDGALRGDLRSLPLADGSVGGIVAFYSLIHVPRPDLASAWGEIARVLRADGAALVSAHEGDGEIERAEFLGTQTPFVASLFQLEELVVAARSAGLEVELRERRRPHPGEFPTTRLYLQARR